MKSSFQIYQLINRFLNGENSMKTLFIVLYAFLISGAASASSDAPQFALIQTDQSAYSAGTKATVTVHILIEPANPNDEIALVAKLGGNEIDITQLSASEW